MSVKLNVTCTYDSLDSPMIITEYILNIYCLRKFIIIMQTLSEGYKLFLLILIIKLMLIFEHFCPKDHRPLAAENWVEFDEILTLQPPSCCVLLYAISIYVPWGHGEQNADFAVHFKIAEMKIGFSIL